MKICASCQHSNHVDANYCSNCGSNLPNNITGGPIGSPQGKYLFSEAKLNGPRGPPQAEYSVKQTKFVETRKPPIRIIPEVKTTPAQQIVTVQAQRTKIKPKAVFLTLLMTGLICSALFAIFYLADWDWNKVGLEPYLVEDINPGEYSSNPSEGVPFGDNQFIFPAYLAEGGRKLFITDGEDGSIAIIGNQTLHETTTYTFFPTNDGRNLVYEARYGGTNFQGYSALWSTDGVESELLIDLLPDSDESYDNVHLHYNSNSLFFESNGFSSRCDLTSKQCTMFYDLENPTLLKGDYFFTSDSSLYKLNQNDFSRDLIYNFNAVTAEQEHVYWHRIEHFNSEELLFCVGSSQFNIFDGPVDLCESIWKTNGETAGTIQLLNNSVPICLLCNEDDRPISDFAVANEILYYAKYGELFRYFENENDSKVIDINPGYQDRIEELFVSQNTLYFTAYNSSGTKLYYSDGTYEGTKSWQTANGYIDVSLNNENTLILGFDDYGMYKFTGTKSEKVSNDVFLRNEYPSIWNSPNSPVILGFTDSHIYLSASNENVGTELWAILLD